jgi:transcriptional regulator with XRE-family HTH domain
MANPPTRPHVRRLRQEAGLASVKAAEAVTGIDREVWTDIETRTNQPRLDRLERVADALGGLLGRYVSVDELTGRAPDWVHAAAVEHAEADVDQGIADSRRGQRGTRPASETRRAKAGPQRKDEPR